MRRTARKAFTLVEILIVVVILGILAAIVVPQFSSAADDARASNTASQLSTLQNAIELFRAREGAYPDFTANGWDELTADTDGNGQPDADFDGDGIVDEQYLKNEPTNAFWTDGAIPATTIEEQAAAGTHGSATAAWVWNVAEQRLFASWYNEAEGGLDATPAATD